MATKRMRVRRPRPPTKRGLWRSNAAVASVQGEVIDRPIVYGSIATPLPKKNEDQHTHKWTVYVRGINNEDISYFIKSVTFRLHESFAQPNRGAYCWADHLFLFANSLGGRKLK